MTPEHDPELERALELVRRPGARPEFRAALRERFLSGAAASGPGAPALAEPRASGRGPRRGRLVLLGAALATAAAIVLAVFLNRPRAAVWTVLDGSSANSILVDGRTIDASDHRAVAAALVSARELEVRGGALRLRVRDEALFELADGTRLSQMQFAAAGPYHLRADHGSLAVATTPSFGQRGLRILTEDCDVTVTGTRFAVDVDARGSCVCCLEGTLACTPASTGTPGPVAAGRLCFSYRDGSKPEWAPAYAPHLRAVEQLR